MPTNICPDCGNELPAGLPEGTCPNCLLKLGVRTAAETPQPADRTTPVPGERPGARIARYKLLEPIGEGGFGTVWLAEQQEPVRRKVALKIIKLGMDTREVVARFEAERQALALMDHPNIARVFDGGATESGRPYFVMELVKGVRITDYCDAQRLSTEERLKLFSQVCQAIQHAHQKGVIHRDLKPSNVLVTEMDGRPVPKVIDFGIAKATEQELTEKTFFTRFNQLIGTPAYMSPEQAGLGSLDVDTRSDIYSLGVLLYELLTGRTPFFNEELLKAGLDQVLRIIREREPPKPSTQLNTLTHADLQTVAQHRASEPARLNRLVRGDLDLIVMKCLEKDRARRYETANGLALDLERHLNNEPVVAAAPSISYQMAKFASRYRVVLATASAFVLLLIVGAVISTWQAVRANRFARAETRARREAVTNWLTAQRSLYAADMNLAADAVDINSLGRATQLLERHRPTPGDPDFRHWEWSYLLRETADRSTYSFHLPGANFNRLGVAPDGRTLAVPCGRSGGVQLWDVASRKVRGELPVPCFQAFFSPKSQWIAAVVSQNGRVDVFDAETRELAGSVPRYLQLNDVAFSLDESLLATTSDEYTNGSLVTLQLWRWRDKKLLAERGFASFQESFHYKVAFHPDGKRIAISQYNGGVRLLRLPDLADDRELKIFDQGTGALAISADGRWLAAAARGSESTIYVWELSNDAPPVILRGHTSEVLAVAFSPDGQWLASGAGDQTVKVWELPQMRLRTTLRGHTSDLRTVGFLAGSAVLVSGDVRTDVKLWDLNATFADTNDLFLPPLNLPALTTDFQRFSGIDSNQMVVTGGTFPSPRPVQISELGQSIRLAAMSPPGDLLASVDQSNTVRLLRLSDRHLVVQTNPYPASIARLGFVKNGEFLVALTDDGAILRWNKDLQEVRPAVMPANFAITKFVFHPGLTINEHDFVFFNTLSGDRVASLVDGRIIGSPKASGGYSGGGAVSRDGRLFAVGKQDGQVEFYDTGTWERVGEPLNCHSDWISAVAFSPDGHRLATNGHGREPVRLWDVESRQQICTLPVEARGYRFLQFSDDGRSLAFAAPSGQIRIITVELPH